MLESIGRTYDQEQRIILQRKILLAPACLAAMTMAVLCTIPAVDFPIMDLRQSRLP